MIRVGKEIINAYRRIEGRGGTKSPQREGAIIRPAAINFAVVSDPIGGDGWVSCNCCARGNGIRRRRNNYFRCSSLLGAPLGVGVIVGLTVGETVGLTVGETVGVTVGDSVGDGLLLTIFCAVIPRST